MTAGPQAMEERHAVSPDDLPPDLLQLAYPIVLRGLVNDWPLVRAGKTSAEAARKYLLSHYQEAVVAVTLGDPELEGRVFYNDDLTGPNTEIVRMPLDEVLAKLTVHEADDRPPLIYVGSTTIDTCLPGLRSENDVPLPGRDALASIWIGNKTRIAAHQDLPDNLACVVVGRRRFTLFPPDQLENLYVGPLDVTPAGQPISLVDFNAPDFETYPKFRQALETALVADLEPGDAIFIPSMWWHHVEASDPFNILANYWWRAVPAYMGSPQTALNHAILALRDLPPDQKAIWKRMFDHYVFDNNEETCAHIPEAGRSILAPMNEKSARRIRAYLLNMLNR